ncbi:MAG: histidine kinase N-terminal 7TM domain-containing protein [Halobacteriales archaeon]
MTILGLPLPSALLFGCSVVFIVFAVYGYRQPETVARRWFVALMLVQVVWTAGYGLELATPDPMAHYALAAFTETVATSVPVVALFFFLKFAGEDGYIRWETLAASLVLPGLTVASYLTNPTTGWAYRSYHLNHIGGVTTLTGVPGPGTIIGQALSLLVVGVSAVVLFRTVLRYRSLYRRHIPWLVLLYAVTVGAFVAYRFGYTPIPGLRLVPFTAPLQGVVYGNLIFRYEIPGIGSRTRRIGREAAIQSLDDGVLIVDENRRIVDYNAAAGELIDVPEESLGRPVEEVLGGAVVEAVVAGETHELDAGADRYVEATATPVTDQYDATVGYVFLLRDVTELRRREQRVSVLNRVLRHNIRNEMSVVKGNADLIARDFEGRPAELARSIRNSADDIVDLGEKARLLEEVLDDEGPPTEVDGLALAREVVDAVAADHPEADLTVAGDHAPVTTRPTVLRMSLRAAVENAAEHGGVDAEAVVEVAPDGAGIEITVADDGPGIPTTELEAVESDRETALEHGSGLGIWLIRWGTEQLGGSVSFDRPEEGGTVVRFSVPETRDGAPEGSEAGVAES